MLTRFETAYKTGAHTSDKLWGPIPAGILAFGSIFKQPVFGPQGILDLIHPFSSVDPKDILEFHELGSSGIPCLES